MLDGLARALDRAVQRVERLPWGGPLSSGMARTTTVVDLGFYMRRLEEGPDALFDALQKPSDVGVAALGRIGGIEISQLSYSSPCQPLHPEFVGPFEAMPENHTCYARWLRPSASPGPTCVLLHDWREPTLGHAVRRGGATLLARRGLGTVVPLLPHHGARRPERARFSGDPFLCSDLACTVESHLQAVRETRALLRWLRERGAAPLGLVGWGIGGLVASLVCGLEGDLDFAVLLLAPSRLAPLVMPEPAPLLREVAEDIKAQGLWGSLEEAWSPLDAARLAPRLPSSKVRILAARGDGLVPAPEVERLARATAAPIEWVAGGHGRPGGALRARGLPGRLLGALRGIGALDAH